MVASSEPSARFAYRIIFGKSWAGFSNVALVSSTLVSMKSVAGLRPFGIAEYTRLPLRSAMQRNSNSETAVLRSVRDVASIDPPDAGDHRSSNVIGPFEPIHVPAIHDT